MSGLFRNRKDTPEGKYLVLRRDGTIPEWGWFVLGARDPAAPAALLAYAKECESLGFDPDYVKEIKELAAEFKHTRKHLGIGAPDSPPDRKDNLEIVEKMKLGHSA